MKTLLQTSVLLVGILLASAVYLDPEKQQQINEVVEAIMGCRDIMGMQLSAVQNGETVFSSGYGIIDADIGNPVTTTTLFGIGSVSKQFTATLLGIILEENGLSWTTKVRDVLGEDFYFHDGLRTSQATMRDLAGHRLGQPRRDFFGFKAGANRRDEAFDTRFVDTRGDFRDSLLYNNNMYNMMAYVTEVLSGEKFEDLMVERIFQPANMASTTFLHTMDLNRDNLARPYAIENIGEPLQRVNDTLNSIHVRMGGAGSIVTSADDMAQWLKLQVDGGRLGGVQVIPESVVRDTHTAVNFWPIDNDLFSKPTIPVSYISEGYALGHVTGWYRGYKMVSHSGSLYGYNSLVTLLPDIDVGIYMVLNGIDYTTLGGLLMHAFVMDILLDMELWLNTTTVCTFPEPWAPLETPEELMQIMSLRDDGPGFHFLPKHNMALTKPYPKDLSPYSGEFGDFFYGNITVFADESQTTLYLQYGLFEPWELRPTQLENVFAGIPAPSVWPLKLHFVIFGMSEEGLQKFDFVVAAFDPSDPTVFRRGLKESDAPNPPNPNECN